MAKTREKKAELIDSLNDKIARMKSAVIVDYKGLKVKDTEQLRNLLREKGVEFNVAKNTLVRIALKNGGIEVADSVLKKPIAIAFAMEDEIAPAKEITLFAKKNEAVEILGGILEKKYIDESAVRQLAALPSREELYAKVVGSIASPLSGMVNVLAGNLRGLVNVLNAYKEKKA